jgi:hypothetical protein
LVIWYDPGKGDTSTGTVIQFDDPLPVGLRARLADASHSLTYQGMMGMDNKDKGFTRFGGILL